MFHNTQYRHMHTLVFFKHIYNVHTYTYHTYTQFCNQHTFWNTIHVQSAQGHHL